MNLKYSDAPAELEGTGRSRCPFLFSVLPQHIMLVVPEILSKSNIEKKTRQFTSVLTYQLYYWHVCLWGRACMTLCVWELALSLHHGGPRHGTRVPGLGSSAFTHEAISLPWRWHFITNKYVRSKNKEHM